MTTTAKPRFSCYADVIKALDAATSKNDLDQLAEQVDAEYVGCRLDMTPDNWGDFASRLVHRNDALEQAQAAAKAPAAHPTLIQGTSAQATYVSVWDGDHEVTAQCLVDINCGIVEAEAVEVEGLDLCEREFVRLPCGAEFPMVESDGDYRVEDVAAFQAAVTASSVQLASIDPIQAAILILRAAHPDLAAAVQQLADRPAGLVPEPNAVHIEDDAGSLYAVSCRLHGDDDDTVYHVRCSNEGAAQAVALRHLYEEAGCGQDPSSPDYREHFVITSQLIAAPVRG